MLRYGTSSHCIIHYLDDFLFVSLGGSNQCQFLLDTFKFFMNKFGVPLSLEKSEDPTTVLSFLGIEIDLVDKLKKLLDLVDGFCAVRKMTLRQMQSLLGLLVFACRIMPMGPGLLSPPFLNDEGSLASRAPYTIDQTA